MLKNLGLISSIMFRKLGLRQKNGFLIKKTCLLLSIIFLHTRSHFIVFDFTMKSLPIIKFYFCWRMLENSLTLESLV